MEQIISYKKAMTETFPLRIIKVDDHQEWTVSVTTDATIDMLIGLVAESTGIERGQFRLVFRGRIISNLPPGHLINECGINSTNNSIILVQRRSHNLDPPTEGRPSTQAQTNAVDEQPIIEEIAPNIYRLRRPADVAGLRMSVSPEMANVNPIDIARDLLQGLFTVQDGGVPRATPSTGGTFTTTIHSNSTERSGDPSNPMVALTTLLHNLYSDDSPTDGNNDSYNAVINITTNSSVPSEGVNSSTQQTISPTEHATVSVIIPTDAQNQQNRLVPPEGAAHGPVLTTFHIPSAPSTANMNVRPLNTSRRGQFSSRSPGSDRSPFGQIFLGPVPGQGPAYSRDTLRYSSNGTQTERVLLPFGSGPIRHEYNSNVSSITGPRPVRRSKQQGSTAISKARRCLQRARDVRYLHTDELQALLSDLSDMSSTLSTDINIFMQKLTSLNRHPSTATNHSQETKRGRAGLSASTTSTVAAGGHSVAQSLVIPLHGHDQLRGSTTNYFHEGIRKRILNLMGMLIHINAAIPHCIDALRNSLSNSMLQIAAHRSGISSTSPITEFGSNELFNEFIYRVTTNEFEERNLPSTDNESDDSSYDWDDKSCTTSFLTE